MDSTKQRINITDVHKEENISLNTQLQVISSGIKCTDIFNVYSISKNLNWIISLKLCVLWFIDSNWFNTEHGL